MLCGSVTSSASTRRCSDRGNKSSRGVRIVAMTFQPRSRKQLAVSRPNPDEHPVIKIVFMASPVGGFSPQTIASRDRTYYNRKSIFRLQESGYDRSACRNGHAAPAERGVLEARQRCRSVERSARGSREAVLLRGPRWCDPPCGRRTRANDPREGGFRFDPGGVRLHRVQPGAAEG